MIQLIVGEKGKGKTKILLDKANTDIKEAKGSIVYLDKNKQHMYELNNKIRLIDVTDYPVANVDAFMGFLCGIVSQDHDLERVFLDSFLTVAHIECPNCFAAAVADLTKISEQFKVDFVVSASMKKEDLAEELQALVIND